MIDLEEGEAERKKSTQEERRRRRDDEERRELERRSEQDQKNFEAMMAGLTATLGGSDKR
jgi:hypothetical protein